MDLLGSMFPELEFDFSEMTWRSKRKQGSFEPITALVFMRQGLFGPLEENYERAAKRAMDFLERMSYMWFDEYSCDY
jgi:hypothetical protein